MPKEPKEKNSHFLAGRLHAQQDILLSMFGYFMILDESFARGLIRTLAEAAENVEKMVGDDGRIQVGYTSEIIAFSVKALHHMEK